MPEVNQDEQGFERKRADCQRRVVGMDQSEKSRAKYHDDRFTFSECRNRLETSDDNSQGQELLDQTLDGINRKETESMNRKAKRIVKMSVRSQRRGNDNEQSGRKECRLPQVVGPEPPVAKDVLILARANRNEDDPEEARSDDENRISLACRDNEVQSHRRRSSEQSDPIRTAKLWVFRSHDVRLRRLSYGGMCTRELAS